MNKKGDKIYSHYYPTWVFKYPRLIHVLYFVNYLLHLRNWHINTAVYKKLNQFNDDFRLLDAGVGEGQFLIPLAKNFPNSLFTGIDKLASHELFCSTYAKRCKHQNVHFLTQELEVFKSDYTYDSIICIGVLQYIQNDALVVKNFYQQLNHGGFFLLYVPVHNRSILPFYRFLSEKLANYETIQDRQRIYNKLQIETMLFEIGFNIEEQQDTYGFFGIISNELINTYFMIFNKSHIVLRVLVTIVFILIYPLILLFMIFDYLLPKSTGNGLLIVARKQ